VHVLLVSLQLSRVNNIATQDPDSNFAEGSFLPCCHDSLNVSLQLLCALMQRPDSLQHIQEHEELRLGSKRMGLTQLYKDVLFGPVHSHQMQEPSRHTLLIRKLKSKMAAKQCMLKA